MRKPPVNSVNITNRSGQSNLNRIREIENEIMNFKKRKLLLKELEEQYNMMANKP